MRLRFIQPRLLAFGRDALRPSKLFELKGEDKSLFPTEGHIREEIVYSMLDTALSTIQLTLLAFGENELRTLRVV